MKRLLDLFVSGFLILFLLVPALAVFLLLRLTGEGKVFFLQSRVGLHHKLFSVYKLATMRSDSETTGTQDITVRDDPRVLPVGKILRKTKINELPQLFNVFRGDMSLVGWRPLMPKSFDMYSDEIQAQIVQYKPGLTGLGSIVFRDEEQILENTTKEFRQCYVEDIAPLKGALELWYGQRQNIWMDLKILGCTAWVIFSPRSMLYLRLFPGMPEPDPNGEISRVRAANAARRSEISQ